MPLYNEQQTKEDILIEALPYIQRYEGRTFVIKYGGAAMTASELKDYFAKDVTLLRKIGINIVIVHGGGKEISELSERLGLETRFVGGYRHTSPEVLDLIVMTLAGKINKEVVLSINKWGGSAVGFCGVDHSLLRSTRYSANGEDLGLVGEVQHVNVSFIQDLLKQGTMPVIAPLGVSDDGEVHNINADVAAAAIAGALKAEKLVYLTDTEGVLVNGELIPTLTNTRAQQLVKQGIIRDGMIPKVQSAFKALSEGVKKVHLVNGTSRHSLLLEIFTNEGVGTQIIREEPVFKSAHKVINRGGEKKPSHLLDLRGLSKQDLEDLFELTDSIKQDPTWKPLAGKTATLIFQKPSLRTKVSFEVGIAQLGGTAVYLSNEGIGLGVRESVADISRVLSRYSDCIIARLFEHELIEELAGNSSVPVINALTDLSHPCQILADLYTIRQHMKLKPGMKVAFIGDGNNVAYSWLEAAAIYPMHLVISSPGGFDPDPEVLEYAQNAGLSTIEIIRDPRIAADSADVLYTDVWTSMGQESEVERRHKAFAPYQINRDLLALANANALVMHCLPAHRGEEITNDVIEGKFAVIFDQAENRLHVQKAILATLLTEAVPGISAPLAAVSSWCTNREPFNHEQESATVYDQGDHQQPRHWQSGGASEGTQEGRA